LPIEIRWNIIDGNQFMRKRSSDRLWYFKISLDKTSLGSLTFVLPSPQLLDNASYLKFVMIVMLLFLLLQLAVLRPSVFWLSPRAITFDSNIVDSSDNFDESSVIECFSP